MAKDTKTTSKLGPLGDAAEAIIKLILDDMKKDMKKEVEIRIYSLTDQMKVLDRVAKFEAIKSRIQDEEGSFFSIEQEEGEDE